MTNQQLDEQVASLGERLRAAREQQGITLKQMGNQLNLPVGVVDAIENDRIEGIAPVYLKGYLCLYARHVGIDEEELCSDVTDACSAPVLRSALPRGSNYSWLEQTGKVAGYLVVTTFVVAPLVWWFTQGAVRLSFDEGLIESQSAQPPINASQPLDAESPVVEEQGSRLHASAAPFLALRNNNDATQQNPVNIISNNAAEIPQESSLVDGGLDTDIVNVDSELLLNQDQVEPQVIELTSGLDLLRLQMVNDSWVEITDTDGQRLEYDLLKSGRIKQYTGKAPFKLLFGRASAVELFLNDAYIDMSPYTRGNVASTTLASNRELITEADNTTSDLSVGDSE